MASTRGLPTSRFEEAKGNDKSTTPSDYDLPSPLSPPYKPNRGHFKRKADMTERERRADAERKAEAGRKGAAKRKANKEAGESQTSTDSKKQRVDSPALQTPANALSQFAAPLQQASERKPLQYPSTKLKKEELPFTLVGDGHRPDYVPFAIAVPKWGDIMGIKKKIVL